MSTKKEREIEYLSSLGLNVIDGETTIKYANGKLTKDGFLRDDVFYDTKRGMCHWVDDRMSIKTEDLNYFLDLIIESKYLSDGLLWGIALSTWPVISRQLHEAKLSTPIVFFVGEPGTLKTSIARMFLTTGRYKKVIRNL